MHFSVFLPLVLAFTLALALSASASLVLPLAATAALRITRRQDGCQSECSVRNETDACGADMACLCTSSIASGLQKCIQCQYEADPTSQQELQDILDQFARGCQTNGRPVGSLTLSTIGASSSTSSVRSASLISTSAISSTASQASATGGATGNGNGASNVAVQMTGAFVAAGVAAALAVL